MEVIPSQARSGWAAKLPCKFNFRVYATGSFAGANRIVSAIGKDGCILSLTYQLQSVKINGLPVLYRDDAL